MSTLYDCASRGDVEGVQAELSRQGRLFIPDCVIGGALCVAAKLGHAGVVKAIRGCAACSKAGDCFDKALLYAAAEGHAEVVELLCGVRPEPAALKDSLNAAVTFGHLNTVRVFTQRMRTRVDFDEALATAACSGHSDIMMLLVAHASKSTLRKALVYGSEAVVRRLLALDTASIGKAASKAFAICCAKFAGRARLLLADPRVDPSANQNAALVNAVLNDNADAVGMLLADARVDPRCVSGPTLLVRAASADHSAVLRLLLDDARLDPSERHSSALTQAAVQGKARATRMLLLDGRATPHEADFTVAALHGYTEVVRLFLEDGRVDPACDDCCALRIAATNRRVKCVQVLLAHPDVPLLPDAANVLMMSYPTRWSCLEMLARNQHWVFGSTTFQCEDVSVLHTERRRAATLASMLLQRRVGRMRGGDAGFALELVEPIGREVTLWLE